MSSVAIAARPQAPRHNAPRHNAPRHNAPRHNAPRPKVPLKGPVLLYTKAGCPYCVRAKSTLRQARVPFREIAATDNMGNVTTLPDGRVRYTVPQMYLPVGGADDMAAWLA